MSRVLLSLILTPLLVLLLILPVSAEAPAVKKLTPSFKSLDMNGTRFTWSPGDSTRSKPLLLWFTNLCSGCQSALPALESIYRDSKSSNVEFAAISLLGEDSVAVRKIIKRFKLSFPILLDPDGWFTASMTGNYIEGTCPMENLILLQSDGTIKSKGHYPGLTESQLKNLFFKR